MDIPAELLKNMPAYGAFVDTASTLAAVDTVCRQAACPNMLECFSRKHAAFLILGDKCTRACAFCKLSHGQPAPPAEDEPERVADAAARLDLRHVVVTSVSRDDLPDGGARQFARTITAVREKTGATLEVLIPDFLGSYSALKTVTAARPEVLAHNLETVRRLQKSIRPQADYDRSLDVLRAARDLDGQLLTKAGMMLGLGEEDGEILEAMADLQQAGCDILTLGQYRQPSPAHLPVQRFVLGAGFAMLEQAGKQLGFRRVLAGSYVRSSYRAGEVKAFWRDGADA